MISIFRRRILQNSRVLLTSEPSLLSVEHRYHVFSKRIKTSSAACTDVDMASPLVKVLCLESSTQLPTKSMHLSAGHPGLEDLKKYLTSRRESDRKLL